MSGVIKSVVKKFKKAGPLGKIAMIAGMIWLGGVASNMFAGPGMGLGEAVTATNASWSSALGMGEAAAGATPGATAGATAGGSVAPAAVTTAAPGISAPITMETGLGLTEATNSVNAIGAGLEAGAGTAAAPASAGMFGGNGGLIAGMMGGNAVMGAMSAAEAEEQRKQEEEIRRSRGLFGVNYDGSQAGGIIRSQQIDRQTPQATVAQTVANPGVAQSNYTPMQPTTRPVNRNDLPALQEQGLIQQKRQAV